MTASQRRYPLGPWGIVCKIDLHASGAKLIATDTYNGYRYDSASPNPGNAGGTGRWRDLFADYTLPHNYELDPVNDSKGVVDICIAPSDPNICYAHFQGFIHRSEDGGKHWVPTNFVQDVTLDSNGPRRFYPVKHLRVDPEDADVVIAATEEKIEYTQDGGTTWHDITADLPAPDADSFYAIEFDASTSVDGVGTPGVFVIPYGAGVHYAADYTSGTWNLTTDSPLECTCFTSDSLGRAWLIDDFTGGGAGGSIWRLDAFDGTWELVHGNLYEATSPYIPFAVTVDPSDTTHVYCVINGNTTTLRYSGDDGDTWVGGAQTVTETATDIPGLEEAGGIGRGPIMFDPSRSNVLMMPTGIGVFECSPAADGTTAINWISRSAGIEQLTMNSGIHPPGGMFMGVSYDRAITRSEDGTLYPTGQYPPAQAVLAHGWAGDCAAGTDTCVVLANAGGTENSGVSHDGGETWAEFENFPPTQILTPGEGGAAGGDIAALTAQDFVICRVEYGSNSKIGPYWTGDDGQTWTRSVFNGAQVPPDTGPTSGWPWAEYNLNQCLAADRVNPNCVAAFNTNGDSTGGGIWASNNKGQSFTRVLTLTELAVGSPLIETKFRAMRDSQGTVFLSGGGANNTELIRIQINYTNLTATRDVVADVSNVQGIGWGAPAPGESVPSCAFAGRYDGEFGYWRSDDDFATPPVKMLTRPLGIYDRVVAVVPDPDTYGIYRVCYKGGGAVEFRLDAAARNAVTVTFTE